MRPDHRQQIDSAEGQKKKIKCKIQFSARITAVKLGSLTMGFEEHHKSLKKIKEKNIFKY